MTKQLGRPSLSERRKDATRLEVAYEAVRLFTEKGIGATSADEVAEAVGISTRTLWRYFPIKEAFVRPLFTAGMDAIVGRVRDWPADRPLIEALATMGTVADSGDPGLGHLRTLVRMTRTEPGLRAVWLNIHHETSHALAALIAQRSGQEANSLQATVQGFTLNAVLLAAVETWAWSDESGDDTPLSDTIREALRIAKAGLPDGETTARRA